MPAAWEELNYEVAVQGNLDPTLLFADWELIETRAKKLLDSMPNRPGFILNLGHGILPKTPQENVKRLVELVQGR
jgi:uroporphyrinogen decarboxylase